LLKFLLYEVGKCLPGIKYLLYFIKDWVQYSALAILDEVEGYDHKESESTKLDIFFSGRIESLRLKILAIVKS